MKLKLPHWLLILYIFYFIILGIAPYDRSVWLAENAPIMLIVLFLVFTYRKFQFSPGAYLLMSVLIFMHTLGGHFTFARVPFSLITDFCGFQRNHYDRLAHFSVGFYAYAIAEFLERKHLSNSRVLTALFAVFSICTVAMAYELFEWGFALVADPHAGIEVLGSQGDVWDAQKDMLADTLGAIGAVFIFLKRSKK